MGKKDKGQQALGRSIIKERFAKKRYVGPNTFLHTSELNDGYDWGRLNLASVTEQSTLEDFLTTAELAGTEFTAEKLNVKYIDRSKESGLPNPEQMKMVKEAQDKNQSFLRIPRRPKWDSRTSADELASRERELFLQWRKNLSMLQEEEHIVLTPYEKNLDFWRQLWRVIERSDVIVQIVDGRNPLLFRCQDLEQYVTEIDPGKVNVVLINKADFLTPNQRKAWANYFGQEGVRVAFWSALKEAERQNQLSKMEKNSQEAAVTDFPEDISPKTVDVDKDTSAEEVPATTATTTTAATTVTTATTTVTTATDESGDPAGVVVPTETNVEDAMNTLSLAPPDSDEGDSGEDSCDSDAVGGNTEGGQIVQPSSDDGASISKAAPVENSSEMFETNELLEFLKSLHVGPKVRPGITTLGMVGYPNVGKSSTINTILKTKKVPVSATPGRTKHFQTLYVDKSLMLCDCPGLVFPSFVSTKAELIVNGILPIDQMRDHVPPVSLVCQQIPRRLLEDIYGIMIPKPDEQEDPNRPPTALELLYAYGYMRGFMTPSSVPDCPRSSRYILKDYVNGKLLYCHSPLGMDSDGFQESQRTSLEKQKRDNPVTEQSENPRQEKLDFDFFSQKNMSISSKGARGVKDYIRLNGLKQVGSEEFGGDKSGKKHHNKNKKGKLRRMYAHLDQH